MDQNLTVEISVAVRLTIDNNRRPGETDDDVFRRLLGVVGTRSGSTIGRNAGDSRPKSLADLVEAGALRVGDTLSWQQRGHAPLSASVEEGGQLHVAGVGRFNSPSGPLRRVTGSELNGWILWRIDRSGETLHEARSRVQEARITGVDIERR
ncbi:hypothetical protein [Microbacterium sp.]|uniref:restriction system modified-DNA reader domain-containing protein n=1 Tax=Microbacterium sp. TaxID=51671 RepID=UPI003F6FBC75